MRVTKRLIKDSFLGWDEGPRLAVDSLSGEAGVFDGGGSFAVGTAAGEPSAPTLRDSGFGSGRDPRSSPRLGGPGQAVHMIVIVHPHERGAVRPGEVFRQCIVDSLAD